MVTSKHSNSMNSESWSYYINTPVTEKCITDFIVTKKLVNENLKGHQKKINEIIKPQLTILPINDLAKSLKKFIQEEVHDILININDDIYQVQAHLQEIEVDI